jgi:uncharacterized membrane protein
VIQLAGTQQVERAQSQELQDRRVYLPWLWILPVAMLATGLFFRFTNLDKKVYWNDEVWRSLRLLGHSGSEMVQQVFDGRELGAAELQEYQRINPERGISETIKSIAINGSEHPPLYDLIARAWVQLFGNSIGAIRSLSAVISLLVFPCLYWLCRELFESSLTAWITVALMTISPFHVLYAQEAYQYSLWTVTVLLSSAALLWAMRLQTRPNWGIYAATVALGLYTHTLFGFVAIAHGVYVAGFSLGGIKLRPFRLPKSLTSCLLATVTGLIAYLPWAAVIIITRSNLQPSWLNKNVPLRKMLRQWSYNFGSVFLDTGGYLYGIGSPMIDLISLSILFLAAYSIYFLCRRTPKRTWFFVLTLTGSAFVPLALADLIWGGQRSAIARYLIPSYLGMQLAFAHLVAARTFSPSSWERRTGQALLTLLIGAGIVSCAISSHAEAWWNKAASRNIPEVARIINRSSRPLVISDSSGLNPWNLISLSYRLYPEVRFRLAVDPKMLTIPEGFSEVFVFNPSESLRDRLERGERSKIEPVYSDGMLGRLVRE